MYMLVVSKHSLAARRKESPAQLQSATVSFFFLLLLFLWMSGVWGNWSRSIAARLGFFLFFCACLLISSRRKRKKKLGYVKIQILLIGEKGAASCVSCAETPGFLVLLCCQRVFPLYLVKDLSVSFDEIYPELLFTAATIVHRSLSLLSDIYRKGRTDGRNKNDSQIELNK